MVAHSARRVEHIHDLCPLVAWIAAFDVINRLFHTNLIAVLLVNLARGKFTQISEEFPGVLATSTTIVQPSHQSEQTA